MNSCLMGTLGGTTDQSLREGRDTKLSTLGEPMSKKKYLTHLKFAYNGAWTTARPMTAVISPGVRCKAQV